MSDQPAAIVLELAPLPREQIGPFLLLGIPKDADREQIEAGWAERVKASRRSQIRVALEDINWAREVINDPERRFRAASASLNLDTADGTLARLAHAYGMIGVPAPAWTPYDDEKPLADYTPPLPVPDPRELARSIAVPEVPLELPAVAELLKQFLPESSDPWSLTFTTETQP
jgi:hypothetical protein